MAIEWRCWRSNGDRSLPPPQFMCVVQDQVVSPSPPLSLELITTTLPPHHGQMLLTFCLCNYVWLIGSLFWKWRNSSR
jgi:hypothetical protein